MSENTQVFCEGCGAGVESDARFCGGCGRSTTGENTDSPLRQTHGGGGPEPGLGHVDRPRATPQPTSVAGNVTDLKTKWARADGPVKVGVGLAAAIVGLVVVVKILPALIAALGIGAFLAILFVPYWIPTIVAFVRKHPSRFGVFAVNFFFGWTFVGWVVSLAWALSDSTGRVGQQTVVVNTTVANTMHAPPPMHRIGDVVNGHLFDGASWVPVGPGSTVGETVSGR